MKILLLGEYSNVHNTLAEALRKRGHKVVLANNGDFWKDYPRDIDLRHDLTTLGTLSFAWRLLKALPKMRGFDIVQLINPVFLELKVERIWPIYSYLRRHNRKVVMLAAGDDYYSVYVHKNLKPLRYSDHNRGKEDWCCDFGRRVQEDWIGTPRETLTRQIARDCDAIVGCAYEYWLPYTLTTDTSSDGQPLSHKLVSIPFPYHPTPTTHHPTPNTHHPTPNTHPPTPNTQHPLRVFIGISRTRSEFKGTDIMLKAAEDLQLKYPTQMELIKVEGVPFDEYQRLLSGSDVMLDQLYSYGPGMNALLALSQGIITFTGGEPEHYDLLGEQQCRPIINVTPDYDSVSSQLEDLILHPDRVARLKQQSRDYVLRNHDSHIIAEQYEQLYSRLLG